ncbi:TPA: DUF2029 domain-containing protein [Candidatus Bathyarchaeota archaeon]|nr:DUF2029 domain-containing protein [Candidatus Bathyarchaeota archaeon]
MQRLTYRDAFATVLTFYAFLHVAVVAGTRMWEWAPADPCVRWMISFCSQIHEHGIFNVWTPYPQGANVLYYGLFLLARLGPWLDFLFWVYYKAAIHTIPNVLTLYLIYRIGRVIGDHRSAFMASMFYAFSFSTYFYGLITNFVYDPLPVLLTVLGLYLLLVRKPMKSAVVLGLGTWVKLFPIFLFMVGLKFFKGRDRRTFALTFSLMTSLCFLPFLLANPSIFLSTYYWQSGRPPWETVYSYILALIDEPFAYDEPYYQDYFMEHTGWLFWGITPNPAILAEPIPPRPLGWWNIVSLLGFLLMFSRFVPAKINDGSKVIGWGAYLLISFFFWNIGWSPQYELFVIPLLLFMFERVERATTIVYPLQGCVALEYALSKPTVIQAPGMAAAKIFFGFIRYAIFVYVIVYLLRRRFVDR